MTETRSILDPFVVGGTAVAEQGVVLLDGPDGIAVAMTADAADVTGSNLLAAARAAREQIAEPGTINSDQSAHDL
jgi:hypothetical protein